MPKPLTVWITINYGKFFKRWEYQTTSPASWEICLQVKKQHLELDMEQLVRFSSVTQSCPTLCDPIDGSPPGPVPGILQARTLEWVAISFSNACMHAKSLQSCPTLCDLINSSPPGSSVHGIILVRILEWVAVSFSRDTSVSSSVKWG